MAELKPFAYYTERALQAFAHSNFITTFDLTFDVKLGIYYLAEIYHLSLQEGRGILTFQDQSGNCLTADDIRKLTPDYDKYDSLREGHKEPLPAFIASAMPEKSEQPYGWLSPQGEFIPSEWGCHEESAGDIVEKRGWEDEFDHKKYDGRMGDFLCAEKGYVLIHNPGLDAEKYVVTSKKPFTKAQREFLYQYFIEIGQTQQANQFIADI